MTITTFVQLYVRRYDNYKVGFDWICKAEASSYFKFTPLSVTADSKLFASPLRRKHFILASSVLTQNFVALDDDLQSRPCLFLTSLKTDDV
jgi:hypothetical protein